MKCLGYAFRQPYENWYLDDDVNDVRERYKKCIHDRCFLNLIGKADTNSIAVCHNVSQKFLSNSHHHQKLPRPSNNNTNSHHHQRKQHLTKIPQYIHKQNGNEGNFRRWPAYL